MSLLSPSIRKIKIRDFQFSVEPAPSDYWDWIEADHYHTDFDAVTRFASPGVTCIDAGAWVGAITLYASRMYKHVYAIEPDPVAFTMLTNNLTLNHLNNVSIYEGALMDHVGTTIIGGTILGCSCTRGSCKINAVSVECVTLRDFCRDIPDPLFIKMDVEGAESRILEDWEFFAERKPDLMLSTHLGWWKEAGSNGREEFAAISKVGRLYRNAFHSEGGRVNFAAEYGDVVFTDKSFQ